jgi:hypothetical protein
MSILIRDETANLAILTIDNSGNMTFGDGTPINMLSLGGYGIIDSNGEIVHGVGSTNLNFTSGVGSLSFLGNGSGAVNSVTIPTLAGQQPTVQLDSYFPTWVITSSGGSLPHWTERIINTPVMYVGGLRVGSFDIQCGNASDSAGATQSNFPINSQNYAYRWL